MADFTIAIANRSDIDVIAPMFDLYRQFYEQAPDLKLASAYIAQRIQRDESIILVAKDRVGAGLGFCQLYPTFCSVQAAPIYTLYDLFVRENCRQRGIGRALLLAAESHAKLNAVQRMDLTTAKDNTAAQALYESIGWVRDEVFYTYNRHTAAANE